MPLGAVGYAAAASLVVVPVLVIMVNSVRGSSPANVRFGAAAWFFALSTLLLAPGLEDVPQLDQIDPMTIDVLALASILVALFFLYRGMRLR